MTSHLTLSDRIKIEMCLNEGKKLNEIADKIEKNRCIWRTSYNEHYICKDRPDCTRKCSTLNVIPIVQNT